MAGGMTAGTGLAAGHIGLDSNVAHTETNEIDDQQTVVTSSGRLYVTRRGEV